MENKYWLIHLAMRSVASLATFLLQENLTGYFQREYSKKQKLNLRFFLIACCLNEIILETALFKGEQKWQKKIRSFILIMLRTCKLFNFDSNDCHRQKSWALVVFSWQHTETTARKINCQKYLYKAITFKNLRAAETLNSHCEKNGFDCPLGLLPIPWY